MRRSPSPTAPGSSRRSPWRTPIPLGARPFAREQYLTKLRSLAEGVVAESELERFIQAAEELPSLEAGDLAALNILASVDLATGPEGIF